MRKVIGLSLLLAGAVPVLAAGTAMAGTTHNQAHKAKVSMETARATALSKVPGTIKTEELEHESGRWIYSFEIRPTGETRKIIKEVNIDADTGELVGKIDTEKD